MQKKPNDTRTVFLLGAGIVFFLAFGLWRILQVMRSANPTSQPPGSTTTVGTSPRANADVPGMASPGSPTLQVASAGPSGAGRISPGQTRELIDALDSPPTAGTRPFAPTARDAMFRFIRPKVEPPTPKNPTPNPGRDKTNEGSVASNTNPFTSWNPPPGSGLKPMPVTPPIDVKLDGVVTGTDGFAMLTIRDTSAGTASTAEQNVYKRVGEKIQNYTIIALTDSGITLRGLSNPWLVGQTYRFGQAAPVTSAPLPNLNRTTPQSATDKTPLLAPDNGANGKSL